MHDIRRALHPQLKRLWEITPFLKTGKSSGPDAIYWDGPSDPIYDRETLSKKHKHSGFNFVPLVTEELEIICALDILFLRPDRPGEVIKSGDIDNRLKTLFDALKIPTAGEAYVDRSPAADEQPFYVLLEDDRLITKITVETDQLLDWEQGKDEESTVNLVISVRLRPYEITLGNMQFG